MCQATISHCFLPPSLRAPWLLICALSDEQDPTLMSRIFLTGHDLSHVNVSSANVGVGK